MKGIVFNLLEDAVMQHHGADAWDALLLRADADGAYTSLGSYPDEEMQRLVAAASDMLALPPSAVLQWFGRVAMPLLAGRFPEFFREHVSTRTLILALNDIIHPEVGKLYPGARCPAFRFDHGQDGVLLLGYRSPRRLCRLAHGFIEGAADHFHEAAAVTHLHCMHDGDPHCTLRVSIT